MIRKRGCSFGSAAECRNRSAERLAEKADLAAVWETPAEEITCANQQKAAVIRAVLSGASLLLVCLDSAMDMEKISRNCVKRIAVRQWRNNLPLWLAGTLSSVIVMSILLKPLLPWG